jgi:hypothetical protein
MLPHPNHHSANSLTDPSATGPDQGDIFLSCPFGDVPEEGRKAACEEEGGAEHRC